MRGFLRSAGLGLVSAALLFAASARAAETITIGLVGAAGPTHWPIHIGLKKGYYAAEDIKLDMIFLPSSGAVAQQLAAGSLDAALSAAMIDPIRAIDKGAPLALVRLEMQYSPYALLARHTIKSIAELKGKTLMVDGPKGITRMFVERMLGAHGVKPNEIDLLFVGATAARFQALQAGAIDATVLLPPFSFAAEAAGYTNLGLTIEYVKDLPFTAAVVNINWGRKNPNVVRKMLEVQNKSVAWFYDSRNRQEAIDIMAEASKLKPDVVAQTYDFLAKHNFFEASGKISKRTIGTLLAVLKELGELDGSTDVERLTMPGVAQLVD